jgi:CHAD domain-containing protein
VPYAIQPREAIPAAVARIMDEQIVRARETLADPSLAAEKRVHEARKRFKETRALIRLVRRPLGKQFRVEDQWFRNAGRDLAAARDVDAMLETVGKLDLPKTMLKRATSLINKSRAGQAPLDPVVANVVDQLVIAQGRVGMWPALEDSFDTIADGLLRTYRQGRRDLLHHETPEELHDWRKRVKEHWYHTQLLRETWPEMTRPYAEVLSSLSRALGDHHDLHVLRGTLGDALPGIVPRIDERQAKLEKDSRAIGSRVYAEKPGVWLARMRNLWNAWTTEA